MPSSSSFIASVFAPYVAVFAERPPGDPPVMAFVIALGIAVAFLALVIWSGKTHRRRLHYVFVPCLLVALTVAIRYAEWTGRFWDFPAVPLRIHLSLAYTATVSTLVAAISGLLHIAGKLTRKAHARLSWGAVLFILLATCTGVWIFAVGEPKPIV